MAESAVLSGTESKAERGFDELLVRSETGLGAEIAPSDVADESSNGHGSSNRSGTPRS